MQCLANVRTLTAAWIMYANENKGRICTSNVQDDSGLVTAAQVTDGLTNYGLAGFNPRTYPVGFWSWIAIARSMNEPQHGMIWTYVKNDRVYACPNAPILPNTTYAMNAVLAGLDGVSGPFSKPFLSLAEIKHSDQTFVFIEECKQVLEKPPVFRSFNTPPSKDIGFSSSWASSPGNYHEMGSSGGTTLSFVDGHAIFWQYSTTLTSNPYSGARLHDAQVYADANQLVDWSGRLHVKQR